MAPRKIHYLAHFCLGNLEGEHPHDGNAFLVHGQHDFKRLAMAETEETFEHMYDEFHRCIVIVQDQDFVERRALGLGTGFGDNPGLALALIFPCQTW